MTSSVRAALVAVLILAVTVPATAGPRRVVREHPGYVAPEAFVKLADDHKGDLVEITLYGRMLKLLTHRAIRRADPELSGVLGGLVAMNAVVADVSHRSAEARELVDKTVRDAPKRGWERFVRVRDNEGSDFTAFMHPSATNDKDVDGLLILGFTGDGELIFVNLVGDIDMERIAMLGDRFGVPGLGDLPARSEVEDRRRNETTDEEIIQ